MNDKHSKTAYKYWEVELKDIHNFRDNENLLRPAKKIINTILNIYV